MTKKILTLIIILTIAISCLSIVSADNDTADTIGITQEDEIVEDAANYILVVSISNNEIKFSDGFTGFCMDSTKDSVTAEDKFTLESTGNTEIENYIKLIIIECYKQNKENEIGKIVSSFVDETYKNNSNEIIDAVLNSDEAVGSNEVININNTTEATFNFELLKSADDGKSDCLAYKVSLKKVANEDKLTASNEDNKENENNGVTAENNTNDKTEDNSKDKNTTEENKTTKNTDEKTVINETNKTIINKTNTVIVNQNNTTIINQNNIKHINNTTDETPKNTTVEEKLMKTVGNPIFILIVVIAVIAVVTVVIRRKD